MKKVCSRMMAGLLIASLALSGIACDMGVVRAEGDAGQEAEMDAAAEPEEAAQTEEELAAGAVAENAGEETAEPAAAEDKQAESEDAENAGVVSAAAAEAEKPWYEDYVHEFDGTDMTLKISKYIGTKGDLVIPAKTTKDGKVYTTVLIPYTRLQSEDVISYTLFDSDVMHHNETITSITFTGGVKIQGDSAGQLITYMPNLVSLDVSGLDTSNLTNMGGMFQHNTSLEKLDLSMLDTANVTNIESIVAGCQSLKRINVSGLATSNVTRMFDAFVGCVSLKELDLSTWNTSNVDNMSQVFSGCRALTKIDVSSFDTSKVVSFVGTFNGCESLTSLDLSNFDGSHAVEYWSMFSECKSLKNIVFSDFNIAGSSYQAMFFGCESLEKLDLSGFDTSLVLDMSNMFQGCRSLTSLDLSSFDTRGLQYATDMFSNCENLKTIYVSDKWSLDAIKGSSSLGGSNTSDFMFTGCVSLVGQNGTAYSANRTSFQYAHIDVPDNPGYFTDINTDTNTHSISGRVIEPNNNGYPGVTITAGGKTVRPDKNGNFTIAGLANGTYEVVATHGNATGKEKVVVNGEDEKGVTITLVKKGSQSSNGKEQKVGNGKVVSQVTTEQDAPAVGIGDMDDGILSAVLTDAERTAVENGGTVVVRLDAEKLEEEAVDDSDRDRVKSCAESAARNAVVGLYLDLNLYKSVGGNEEKAVTDLKGNGISVELDVPVELHAPRGTSRRFYIIRVHNGVAELLASTTGTHITFKTDKFSVYSLAYSDTAQSAPAAGNSGSQADGRAASSGSGTQTATRTTSSGGSSSSSSSSDTHRAGKGAAKAEYTITGKKSVRYEYPAFGGKKKTAKIPDTVDIGKKTYKVTSVASYAFAGYDKVTAVAIGGNVKKIGKNAFEGISKKATITVSAAGKKRFQAMKKKLRKSGIAKTVKIQKQ